MDKGISMKNIIIILGVVLLLSACSPPDFMVTPTPSTTPTPPVVGYLVSPAATEPGANLYVKDYFGQYPCAGGNIWCNNFSSIDASGDGVQGTFYWRGIDTDFTHVSEFLDRAALVGRDAGIMVQIYTLDPVNDEFDIWSPSRCNQKHVVTAAGCANVNMPAYDNLDYLNCYTDFIRRLGAEFNSHATLDYVSICTGVDGESAPIRDWHGCRYGLTGYGLMRIEHWKRWEEEVIKAYREAFPDKFVYWQGAMAKERQRYLRLEYMTGLSDPVGYKPNGFGAGVMTNWIGDTGNYQGILEAAYTYLDDVPLGAEMKAFYPQTFWAWHSAFQVAHFRPDFVAIQPRWSGKWRDLGLRAWLKERLGKLPSEDDVVWWVPHTAENLSVDGYYSDWPMDYGSMKAVASNYVKRQYRFYPGTRQIDNEWSDVIPEAARMNKESLHLAVLDPGEKLYYQFDPEWKFECSTGGEYTVKMTWVDSAVTYRVRTKTSAGANNDATGTGGGTKVFKDTTLWSWSSTPYFCQGLGNNSDMYVENTHGTKKLVLAKIEVEGRWAGSPANTPTAGPEPSPTYTPATPQAPTPTSLPGTPAPTATGVVHGRTIAVDKDTTITSIVPTANHGPYGKVFVSTNESALMRFDVGAIPSTASVTRATLHGEVQFSNHKALSVTAYTLLRDWKEHEATWNNATSTVSWATAGAAGSTDRGTPSSDGEVKTYGTIALDVTELVADWVDGDKVNYGLILVGTSGDGFHGISSGNGSAPPYLTVEYLYNAATATATATPLATGTPQISVGLTPPTNLSNPSTWLYRLEVTNDGAVEEGTDIEYIPPDGVGTPAATPFMAYQQGRLTVHRSFYGGTTRYDVYMDAPSASGVYTASARVERDGWVATAVVTVIATVTTPTATDVATKTPTPTATLLPTSTPTWTVTPTPTPWGSEPYVVLNEVLTDPAADHDYDGRVDDDDQYVEVYNRGSSGVSLNRWYVIVYNDKSVEVGRTYFPRGFGTLGAGEFFTLRPAQIGTYLPDSGRIEMFNSLGEYQDNIDWIAIRGTEVFGPLCLVTNGVSCGRLADGVEDWVMLLPSPGYANTTRVTPTVTPTATTCWSADNEDVPPGDWDGTYVWDTAGYVIRTNAQKVTGTYSYKHYADGPHSTIFASTYIVCTGESAAVDISGNVRFDHLPDYTSYLFLDAVDGEYLGSRATCGIYMDAVDGDKIKVRCLAGNATESNETWTVTAGGISADTWYSFRIKWNLPDNTPNGTMEVWWEGVKVVSDPNVQTETTTWKGTDRVYVGIIGWHYLHGDQIVLWTDDYEGCGCK